MLTTVPWDIANVFPSTLRPVLAMLGTWLGAWLLCDIDIAANVVK